VFQQSISRVQGSIQQISKLRIGSLCTGYGGLDLAVEAHFNAETVWCAESDKYASQVIEQRFNIPNYGNIKEIDWATLPSIDILTAGYPCQPFSHAGERKGTQDERHLFPHIAEAIGILKPRWVVLENVRGHLSLGLKEVLACLTNLGYDARWQIVRASDVGAPHKRARIFIVAHSNSHAREESRRTLRSVQGEAGEIIYGTDRTINGSSYSYVSDTDNEHQSHDGQMQKLGGRFTSRREMHLLPAPDALDQDGKLNARFVEYMMGLWRGWVTDTGLSRAQQLKILGNGVVPQQAQYALELLTSVDNLGTKHYNTLTTRAGYTHA
jgi:DNA (cytosine-5)-methyltransferase 1